TSPDRSARGAVRAPGLALVYDWAMRVQQGAAAFSLASPAFTDGAPIPVKHTCDGADVSPPLAWHGAPAGTQAFSLIAEDPDPPVGTWVHWVLYDLPADVSQLPEGLAKTETLPELGGALQGRNDFRRLGYGGPWP